MEFSNIYQRDHLHAEENGCIPVVKQNVEPHVDDVEEEEYEMVCEVCHRGDREHLLLLCDSCDLGYHTTCLSVPLSHVPRGRWFCDTCSRVTGNGNRNNRPAPARVRRRSSNLTRTRHLERIRNAVSSARAELERRFENYLSNNRVLRKPQKARRKPRRSKKKPTTSRRGCKGKRSRIRVDKAIIDNVRKALGINDQVYNEQPVPLALFGNYNQFDPVDFSEDEQESFSSQVLYQ